jgi:GNAT superfamily N-acetyltransferase
VQPFLTMPVVRTYLELTDAGGIRPAAAPRINGDVRIAGVDPPDGATSRWFYTEVGRPHAWTDHLKRTDAEWQAWAESAETWVATVDGDRAGYYELRRDEDGAGVEVAYFGLLPHAQGHGLGGHLLTHALERGFELGPRVWLHTCTLDGPHALANYQARGLRPFCTEVLEPGGEICYLSAKILRR